MVVGSSLPTRIYLEAAGGPMLREHYKFLARMARVGLKKGV